MNSHTSDELFDLVHALSKNEKQYFKKFARIHIQNRDNKYLILFDAICKLKEYDELKLIKQLENSDFVNHLPRIKNYLYDFILKSLRSYHAESSKVIEVMDLLQKVEILYSKNMADHSAKLIRKARKISQKNDFDLYFLEIIIWELTTEAKSIPSDKIHDYYNNKLIEFNKHLQIISERTELDIIGRKVNFLLYNNNKSNNKIEYDNIYKKLIYIEKSTIDTSPRKKLTILIIKLMLSTYNENNSELTQIQKELLMVFEKDPYLIKIYPSYYLSAIQHQIAALIQLKEYDRAVQLTKEIIKQKDNLSELIDNSLTNYALDYYFIHMLNALSGKGDADRILLMMDDAYKYATRKSNNNSAPIRKIKLLSSLAYASFVAEEYKLTLKITNLIINNKQYKNQGTFFQNILLNILVHIEKHNTEYASYVLENYKSILHKKGEIPEFERTETKALELICNSPISDREKLASTCALYIDELVRLKNPHTNDHFQLIYWLQAKAKKISLSAFLQEQYHMRMKTAQKTTNPE